ncbi:MAG: hypothetical protein COB37_09515 [Kordiimonadales bacterium]|nr:MAG: hypothetical protein COB37_09515 [Kordiimonadales bacterium]
MIANPNSIRLNISRSWESEWYGKKKYPVFVQEDLFIRNYLQRRYKKYYTCGSCLIQRSVNNVLTITFLVYSTKRIFFPKYFKLNVVNFLSKYTNMKIYLRTLRYKPASFHRSRRFFKKRDGKPVMDYKTYSRSKPTFKLQNQK